MSKTYTKVGAGNFFYENPQTEKQPAFKGKVEISGREFELAAWPRTSKGGHNYLSVQFSIPGQRERVGDGALFERQPKNHKAPRMSGPLEIQGIEFMGSVWPQKSEAGNEYFRMKVELVEETGGE